MSYLSPRHAMPTSLSGNGVAARTIAYAAVVVAAVVAGFLTAKSPKDGIAVVAMIGLTAVALRMSRIHLVEFLLALLPWTVIFDSMMPHLLKTFLTAAGALAMLYLAVPLRWERYLGPVTACIFIAIVLSNGVMATQTEEFQQVAKYLIFPAVSLAVLSKRGQEQLPHARNIVLASCLAAMLVQMGIVSAGLGQTGTKYDIGEKLGFARAIVHEMGLTCVVVAAAGLISTKRLPLQVAFFALGAVPAMLTGVRSALLALIVVIAIFVIRSKFDRRSLTIVALVLVVAIATGGAQVVINRFNAKSPDQTALASGGFGLSERNEIWSIALDAWGEASPPHWVYGLGLGAVEEAEIRKLGKPLFGHSDVVEIVVALGFIGLAAWIILWIALLASPLEGIVLIPIIVYAVVNGSIEYVAPLTLGLFFAAACRPPPELEAPPDALEIDEDEPALPRATRVPALN
jgi:O-Antigen ligase